MDGDMLNKPKRVNMHGLNTHSRNPDIEKMIKEKQMWEQALDGYLDSRPNYIEIMQEINSALDAAIASLHKLDFVTKKLPEEVKANNLHEVYPFMLEEIKGRIDWLAIKATEISNKEY